MQGQLFLVGGVGALGVDNLYKGNRDAERGKVFPETYLMYGKFYLQGSMREDGLYSI